MLQSVEQGSPDLKAAKEVADYLGTVHHEFHFTVQVLALNLESISIFFLFVFFLNFLTWLDNIFTT